MYENVYTRVVLAGKIPTGKTPVTQTRGGGGSLPRTPATGIVSPFIVPTKHLLRQQRGLDSSER